MVALFVPDMGAAIEGREAEVELRQAVGGGVAGEIVELVDQPAGAAFGQRLLIMRQVWIGCRTPRAGCLRSDALRARLRSTNDGSSDTENRTS